MFSQILHQYHNYFRNHIDEICRFKIMLNPFKAYKNLVLSIRGVRRSWMAKSPPEKWNTIHDFGQSLCELIGIRVFSDMKNDWYTASCGVCAFIYFALDFYTIQYYLRRNDFVKVIECTYLVGAVVGVREIFECFQPIVSKIESPKLTTFFFCPLS